MLGTYFLAKYTSKRPKHPYTITLELLNQERDVFADIEIQHENLKLRCDVIKKVQGVSKLGNFYYVPILVIPGEKVTRKFIIVITGITLALNSIQGNTVGYGEIFCAANHRLNKIRTDKYLSRFYAVVTDIFQRGPIFFYLNSHCNVCEYSRFCKEKAVKEDHLSMLRGIPQITIEKLNNKGIFTINQLSYTFRPKRKSDCVARKFVRSFALQALAIREKSIFVYDLPKAFPDTKVELFFDIEGIPEKGFQYLIGLTIRAKNKIDHMNFWSDSPDDELSMSAL